MPTIETPTEVDPERRAQWLWPSAARIAPPNAARTLVPLSSKPRWRQGDLLLAQVLAPIGQIDHVENVNRCEGITYRASSLFPGAVTVVVLAPRAGTNTCVAEIPPTPVPELHLHGVGGQAARIVPGSEHSVLYRGAPTRVRILARIADEAGHPLNTRVFGAAVDGRPRARRPEDAKLILVVGSDMDCGKTTVARRVIYSLRAMGHPVVAGKALGVGSFVDIGSMYDAGAAKVMDFTDVGEPTTVDLPRERVLDLFHHIVNSLRLALPDGGFVVLELSDGIWFPETRCLLEEPSVRDAVDHVVFACTGVLDGEAGLGWLMRWRYGDKIRAVSGRVASSGMLRASLPELLRTEVPVFDALDYEASPQGVAAAFTRSP
jgi:hypothetical protein